MPRLHMQGLISRYRTKSYKSSFVLPRSRNI